MDDPKSTSSSDAGTRRLSRFLAIATLIAMVGAPFAALMPWLFPGLADLIAGPVATVLGGPDLDWFSLPLRLGAAGLALIPLGITLYGLSGLRSVFRACAAGAYFSAESVSGFRQFAVASLASAIWSPIEHTAYTGYLSAANPYVQSRIEISFGSPDVQAVGLALLFFLVTHLLAQGRRTQEEMELFL
tara:strand:- start:5574 stop:6137 length:564 start_codon:yes stop_codon:yes gene_type:complete